MSQPFNGWGSSISIQAEDVFNGASAQPVYSLAGQIRFTQIQNLAEKRQTIDVWRNATGKVLNTRYYSGTIEIEFGFNAVVLAIMSGFFELVSTSSVGGALLTTEGGSDITTEGGSDIELEGGGPSGTQYIFRPPRLKPLSSFKIGIGYSGQTFWTYGGLVIDSIQFVMQRNRIPSLLIAYKAAAQNLLASSSMLGSATTVAKNTTDHTQFSATFDANALALLSEANMTFTHTKRPGAFSASGTASIFTADRFQAKGQLAEYFNADSLFPAALADQADHAYFQQLLSPTNVIQKLQITWPRICLSDSLPDAISRTDLVYRVNFDGFQDTIIGTTLGPAPTLDTEGGLTLDTEGGTPLILDGGGSPVEPTILIVI